MSSSVVAFPLYRYQKLLTGVVHILRVKHGDEANSAWKKMAKELLGHLTDSGVEAEAAEAEVRHLLYAALAEIKNDAATASG